MPEIQTPPQIAMLLYPDLTLLDLIGSQTVFSMNSKIYLVWKTLDPVISDTGISIRPTTTFHDCPSDVDVLFVPGGFGVEVMKDPEVLAFLADRGSRAKYVTSVCSGSLVLGAAGLLRGYKATSHWAARQYLPNFGAEPVEARVVTDRNRVTGGGVTAGIDFGLVLLSKILVEEVAKITQLMMEYDPQPPFNAGSPEKAGAGLDQQAMKILEPFDQLTRQAAGSSAV